MSEDRPSSLVYEEALNELRRSNRDGGWSTDKPDLLRWADHNGLTVCELLDELAIELACDFFVGFLGWEFVDWVANDLRSLLFELTEEELSGAWPETFWEFFLVFDHSELEGPKDRELVRDFLEGRVVLTG